MQQIYAKQLQLAESARVASRLTVPSGTTVDDLLVPANWTHLSTSPMIQRGAIVEVVPDDMSWYAEFLVRGVEPGVSVTVGLVTQPAMFSVPSQPSESVLVEYRQRSKWCVIRRSDGMMISKGHDTEESAHEWLAGHTI